MARETPAESKSVKYRLAGVLREKRMQRGWTQAELANKAGLSRTTVANLEQAAFDCGLDTFVSLSVALGEEPQVLLGQLFESGKTRDPFALKVLRAAGHQ